MPMLLHGHLFFYACKCADLCCVCVSDRTCCMAGSRWRPWPTSGTKKSVRDPQALRMTKMKQNCCELNKPFQFIRQQGMDIVLRSEGVCECVSIYLCECVWRQALFSVLVTCTSCLITCHKVYVTKEFHSLCGLSAHKLGWNVSNLIRKHWMKENKCCMKAVLLQAMETEYLCLLICGAAQRKSCWSR